jgi:uncharacterized protein (TIGR03083 family)
MHQVQLMDVPALRRETVGMESPEADVLRRQLDELTALLAGLSDADFAVATRCPGWTVAELVAHCEGMLLRLVGANAREVGGPPEIDRAGYYRYDPAGPREDEDPARTFSEVIRQRVIDEVGGRTPDQLRAALGASARAALEGVAAIPASRVIRRSGHPPMLFSEFVAARVLEFGVHTMDIAHAVDRPERVHPSAEPVVTSILDGLLGQALPGGLGWDATTYILVGTGRRGLSGDDRQELGALAERFPLLA